MSWGTKLIVAMALFMGFIIALSTRMILSDKDDLVEKDYYEKGLSYDHDYVRKKNVSEDHAEPVIQQINGSLKVSFKAPSTGTVRFTHSKDRKQDRLFTINSDSSAITEIPLRGIERGNWRLAFEWKSGGRMYLYDKEVFIQ